MGRAVRLAATGTNGYYGSVSPCHGGGRRVFVGGPHSTAIRSAGSCLMAWPELRVHGFPDFNGIAQHLTEDQHTPRRYFFRGQADAAWHLTPSLIRAIPAGSMTVDGIEALQREAMEKFKIEHSDVINRRRHHPEPPPV